MESVLNQDEIAAMFRAALQTKSRSRPYENSHALRFYSTATFCL
jgi:hypothetical protein